MKQLVTFNQQKHLTSSEIPNLSKKSKKIFQKKKKAFVDYWFFLIFQTFNITFTINNTLWFSLNVPFLSYWFYDCDLSLLWYLNIFYSIKQKARLLATSFPPSLSHSAFQLNLPPVSLCLPKFQKAFLFFLLISSFIYDFLLTLLLFSF